MSTIPLSMREGHGQTLSGSAAPVIAPDDDTALDALIEHVTDTVANRGRAGDPADEPLLDVVTDGEGGGSVGDPPDDSWRALKSRLDDPEEAAERGPDTALDRALKAAVDRRAGQEAESADFHGSRAWRDELRQRYDGRIAIGDLLESFAHWHEQLKADPSAAGAAIAASYLAQPQYALKADAGAAQKPAAAGDAEPGRTLNRVLAAAIDRHHGKGDGEPAVFAASARHRAALKEMFPGMTYAEACRRVVTLDRDLHRDPLATAARLAESYGMSRVPEQPPVTGEHEAPLGHAQQTIAATEPHLPGLEQMQDEIAGVLERPDFVHGPDMQQNLMRAYQVAQLAKSSPTRSAALDGLIAQAMQGASPA